VRPAPEGLSRLASRIPAQQFGFGYTREDLEKAKQTCEIPPDKVTTK